VLPKAVRRLFHLMFVDALQTPEDYNHRGRIVQCTATCDDFAAYALADVHCCRLFSAIQREGADAEVAKSARKARRRSVMKLR
jgi:hypothetical protein